MEIEHIKQTDFLTKYNKNMTESNIQDSSVLDIFKDPDDDYFFQRPDYEQMGFLTLEFLDLGLKTNMFLSGSKGSGKTVNVRHQMKYIKKNTDYDFNFKYINCSGIKKSFDIITKKMPEVDKKHSRNPQADLEHFFSQQTKKTIMVLDEVDHLEDDYLLYDLSRHEVYKNVLLILITKKPKFLQTINDDVLSSLALSTFYFDNYDKEQLTKILDLRAKKGLKNYNKELLEFISEQTVRQANSDVRIGISVMKELFKSNSYIDISEEEYSKVSLKIVNLVKNEYFSFKSKIIERLSFEKILVLYSVIFNETINESLNFFNKYSKSPMSYSHFRKMVHELKDADLIIVDEIRVGRSKKMFVNDNIGDRNIDMVVNLLNNSSNILTDKLPIYY